MIYSSAFFSSVRKSVFSAVFLMLLPLCVWTQTVLIEAFDLEDHESLLTRFFDSDSISPMEEVLWEPLTLLDQLSSNVSSDGLVHTGLDTVMYFSIDEVSKAVVLFETLPYDGGSVVDCHECGAQVSAAVFDKIGAGRWQVVKFMKHFATQGSYGLNGESGLVQFGEQQWCLRLQMSWEGQGVYGEYVTFYKLEDFDKMFHFTLHEDNMGVFEDGSERSYAFDKSIHFIPSVETATGWWDFDMVTQGTRNDDDIDRAVPANEVIRYHFDWETDNYIKSHQ